MDPSKWKGKNVFGDLLTKLRDSMMKHELYQDEVKQMKEITSGHGKGIKWAIESPTSTNDTKRPN